MCKYHNYLYIASTVLTDAVPSDVTEGDTSQDVLTSYPHTIPSGISYVYTIYKLH